MDLARHRQVRVVPAHRQRLHALLEHVLAQRVGQERVGQARHEARIGDPGVGIAAPPVHLADVVAVPRPLGMAADEAARVAEAGVPDQIRRDRELEVGVGRALLRLVAQQHVVVDAERRVGPAVLLAGVVVGDRAVAVAGNVAHLAVDQLVPVAVDGIVAAGRLALEFAPGRIRRAVELVEVDDDVVRDAVVRTGIVGIGRIDHAVGEAVQQRDLVGVHVVRADHQVRPVVEEVEAGCGRDMRLARVALLRQAGGHRQRGAVHALLHHHVDRAGDGVGAVDRGRATGDGFDALDQRRRDGVEVDRRGARAAGHPAQAVDQHQRAVGAHAAQVDVGHALVELLAHRVHFADARADRRIELQRVVHGEAAGVLHLLEVHHRDRHHRLELGTGDAAAGDDDVVQGLGHVAARARGLVGRLLLRRHGGSERDQQCGREQMLLRLVTEHFHLYLSLPE